MPTLTLEFMLAGGTFKAEVPDEYLAAPQAESAVRAFGGVRSIGFCPAALADPRLLDEFVHHHDVDADGVTVSLYERPGEPLTYTAVWRLNDGVVTTFMDEPTARLDALEFVVQHITLTERAGRAPRLALNGGLQRGDIREPTHRDGLQFVTSEGFNEGRVLQFHEEVTPPRTAQGGVSRTDPDGHTVYRVLPAGVRVQLHGPREATPKLDRAIDEIARSVRPV